VSIDPLEIATIMAEKAKAVAIEEAERIKSLTVTAARSGAYLYPLRVSLLLYQRHSHGSEPSGMHNR